MLTSLIARDSCRRHEEDASYAVMVLPGHVPRTFVNALKPGP